MEKVRDFDKIEDISWCGDERKKAEKDKNGRENDIKWRVGLIQSLKTGCLS